MPPDDQAYEPPPAFAPPALRSPALNEREMLGAPGYAPGSEVAYEVASELGYEAGAYEAGAYGALSGSAPYPWPAPVPPATAPTHLRHRLGRRSLVIGSLVLVALVALTVVLTVSSAPSRARHAIALPAAVGGYVKQHEMHGPELLSLVGAGMLGSTIVAGDLNHAKAAVYSNGTAAAPALMFLGFNADESPTIGDQLHHLDPGQITHDILAGAGLTVGQEQFSPGPLGGAMRCAELEVGHESVAIGVWADHDTLGLLVLVAVGRPPTLGFTAGLTRTMRAAAET